MKNLSSLLKGVILLLASSIIFLSLISYTPRDITLLSTPSPEKIINFIGLGGAYIAFVLRFLFGAASFFIAFYLFFVGLHQFQALRFYGLGSSTFVNSASFLLFTVSLAAFIGLFFADPPQLFQHAGAIGYVLATFLRKYLRFGAFIVLALFMAVSSLLLFGYFFVDVGKTIRVLFLNAVEAIQDWRQERQEAQEEQAVRPAKKKILKPVRARESEREKEKPKKEIQPEIKVYTPKVAPAAPRVPPPPLNTVESEAAQKKIEELEKSVKKQYDPKTYKLPSYELLKVPPSLDYRELKEDIQANIKNLEETFLDFGVEAKVVSVQKGPVVTMYEVQLSAGTKIQKISVLSDDIALSMKSSSVRIVAPLPGRGTVGIEIPNLKKHIVYLREVLEEKSFITAKPILTMAVGKDVAGAPVTADLGDMPHLLIAGATGAGKTVCVNALICSILMRAKPDEVKFILVDPKMVELAPFAGIPHLLHPIISESKKAFIALGWAVEEMEKRYRLLAGEGARNIALYNKNAAQKLPHIIIIVDELADLMVVARDKIETSIQRLAQLSRAVGIHLILATQRPSVDVITGVIKANFPARISFKVASKVDSRTVLDMMGADKLLGKGDLLFLKPGAIKLIRAQGAFIDDEDIETLTSFIRAQGGPVYEAGIAESEKKSALHVEQDELFDDAVKAVLHARQASASLLQRRLRVGYTRAARLLDLMEQAGVVGPFCGSKAREILVNPQEYLEEGNPV